MRDRFIHIGRLTIAEKLRPGLTAAYQKVGKTVMIRNQPFVQLADADYQTVRKQFPPKPAGLAAPKLPSVGGVVKKPIRSFTPSGTKLPGILTQAKNAATAACRVITAAGTNQAVTVPDAEFQRRMAVCSACEFLDNSTQRCGKCGCFIAAQVIGKARLATETCPIGKWAKKEP